MNPNEIEGLADFINNIVDDRLTEYHQQNIVPYLKKNSVGNRDSIIELYVDRIFDILTTGKVPFLKKDGIKKELGIHDSNLVTSIIDRFLNKYQEQGAYKGKNTSRQIYIMLKAVE